MITSTSGKLKIPEGGDTVDYQKFFVDNFTALDPLLNPASKLYLLLQRTTDQAIAASTMTIVQFPTISGTQTDKWSPTSHRFAAPKTGLYQLSCALNINTLPQFGACELYLFINGVQQFRLAKIVAPGVTSLSAHGAITLSLNANDYLELKVFSGAATNVGNLSYLTITQLTY